MATKKVEKCEICLNPHNDEWIKLIPNPDQNMDIIFNKIIENAKKDGSFLEVISQTLTLADLAKFKTAYAKMNTKRAEHIAELDIPQTIERKTITQQPTEQEEFIFEEPVSIKKETNSKKEKKITHGFDESTF